MSDKKIPNFLIIGAAKSGTSALRYYLNQHPEVFMADVTEPWKEPRYFSSLLNFPEFITNVNTSMNSRITTLENYRNIFKNVNKETAIGEKSVEYLYAMKSADHIYSFNPEMKIIVSLRNPVDRAYSQYLYNRRINVEKKHNFEEAVKLEDLRIKKLYSHDFHYINVGLYYENLKYYIDTFGREKMRIYLYDTFFDYPLKVLSDIFEFLRVDDLFVPNMRFRPNVSFIPKSRLLYEILKNKHQFEKKLPKVIKNKTKNVLNSIDRWNQLKPEMNNEIKEKLKVVFKKDILKTQDLIQKDLSNWL